MTPFNVFQTAYVVADIENGIAIAKSRFGMSEMAVTRDVSIQTGHGLARCHFALAFVGTVQVEIIQPAGGTDDVYCEMLPDASGLRLHHLGVLMTDESEWRRFVEGFDAAGEIAPVRGSFGDLMHYLYVDRRAEFGHYIEYMCQTTAGAHLFDNVPHYPGVPIVTTIPFDAGTKP